MYFCLNCVNFNLKNRRVVFEVPSNVVAKRNKMHFVSHGDYRLDSSSLKALIVHYISEKTEKYCLEPLRALKQIEEEKLLQFAD